MAMSEWNDASVEPTDRVLADGRILPDDFEPEDVAFAHFLSGHFDIEGENLPPRYAQTLLGNPLYGPVADDFADRISAAVFQRLNLTRPAPIVRREVRARRVGRHRTPSLMIGSRLRRVMVALAAIVTLVAFTPNLTGTAFASALNYLFAGHSGGVKLVASYPKIHSVSAPKGTVSAPLTSGRINFTTQWPGDKIEGYTFINEDIFNNSWWTDGALVTLNYEKTTADGVKHLTLLEFMPHASVALQVVQNGSATSLPNGATNGIFVMGGWGQHVPSGLTTWQTDLRAELICSDIGQPGLVTWVATDDVAKQSPDVVRAQLEQVTKSLKPLTLHDLSDPRQLSYDGDKAPLSVVRAFGNDIVALAPDRTNPNSPIIYIRIGGSDATPPNGNVAPSDRSQH